MADRLFLDANVLFSAAYGSPSIERLWDAQRAGSCRLLVSRYVIEEARRNLRELEQIRRLDTRLRSALVVPESPADRCPVDLPDKDRPIFSAAAAATASLRSERLQPVLGGPVPSVRFLDEARFRYGQIFDETMRQCGGLTRSRRRSILCLRGQIG